MIDSKPTIEEEKIDPGTISRIQNYTYKTIRCYKSRYNVFFLYKHNVLII